MAAAMTLSSLISDSSENVAAPTVSSSVPSVSELSHRGGLRGMFKVPSLVFDIELEDNGIGGHWQEDDWEEDEVVTEIQRFVQPTTAYEARLLNDVRVACPLAKDGQDTMRLVSILSALGYKCGLRTALGGGDGADCLRNLRHTFITCEAPAAPCTPARRFIVDAQFKEQFIIAKATARYASILAAIPQVFVGPEEHLSLLVNFLCTEMSTAFRQLGAVLPPWRHASSMLSKWKPRKSVDESMGSGMTRFGELQEQSGTAEAAAAAATTHMPAPAGSAGSQAPWSCRSMQAPGGAGGASAGLQPLSQCHLALRAQQELAGAGGGMRRPTFEPQRVVFGGNFATVAPTPAHAS